MTIKTKLSKLFELPGEKFMQFLSWARVSLPVADPEALIAEAYDSHGQTLAYISARKVMLLDGYAVNPSITTERAQQAGDSVDFSIANLAQREGVTSMLITIPEGAERQPGELTLRLIERPVTSRYEALRHLTSDSPSLSTYIN
jgi:hypothetical protein